MKHVRGVIVEKTNILLIHRIKANEEYFIFPGGCMEANENENQTLAREIREETNLSVITAELFCRYHNEHSNEDEAYYLVTEFSGTVTLGFPEKGRHCSGNQYYLEWHAIGTLDKLPLLPAAMKRLLLSGMQRYIA